MISIVDNRIKLKLIIPLIESRSCLIEWKGCWLVVNHLRLIITVVGFYYLVNRRRQVWRWQGIFLGNCQVENNWQRCKLNRTWKWPYQCPFVSIQPKPLAWNDLQSADLNLNWIWIQFDERYKIKLITGGHSETRGGEIVIFNFASDSGSVAHVNVFSNSCGSAVGESVGVGQMLGPRLRLAVQLFKTIELWNVIRKLTINRLIPLRWWPVLERCAWHGKRCVVQAHR